MSWEKLTGSELQAMRKLLMIDVSEAAKLIGNVSPRAWQYWESGRNAVPDDVDMEIYALVQLRSQMIEDLFDADELVYYHSYQQWLDAGCKGTEIAWRVHQSAVAHIFSQGGDVRLK